MKRFLLPFLVILLIAMTAVAVYFYQQTTNANPAAQAEKEAEELVVRVGKLILLPEGETPTVATVSDPERLKDQPFFAKAKVGDKVLLYQTSKKAYLYDPVNNKLLEVAPINLGANEAIGTETSSR